MSDTFKNSGVNINAWKISKLRPIADGVIVIDMNFGEQKTQSGLIIQSDNGKTHGIHPRWAQVYAVGNEQQDVTVGQWILIEHGRWTRGLDIQDDEGTKTIRRIDPQDILLVSDEHPGTDDTISSAVSG